MIKGYPKRMKKSRTKIKEILRTKLKESKVI
jgi:hypothetical protein